MNPPEGIELGTCEHHGFHSVMMRYERDVAELVSYVCCDHCGAVLAERSREHYRPRFRPADAVQVPVGPPGARP